MTSILRAFRRRPDPDPGLWPDLPPPVDPWPHAPLWPDGTPAAVELAHPVNPRSHRRRGVSR